MFHITFFLSKQAVAPPGFVWWQIKGDTATCMHANDCISNRAVRFGSNIYRRTSSAYLFLTVMLSFQWELNAMNVTTNWSVDWVALVCERRIEIFCIYHVLGLRAFLQYLVHTITKWDELIHCLAGNKDFGSWCRLHWHSELVQYPRLQLKYATFVDIAVYDGRRRAPLGFILFSLRPASANTTILICKIDVEERYWRKVPYHFNKTRKFIWITNNFTRQFGSCCSRREE